MDRLLLAGVLAVVAVHQAVGQEWPATDAADPVTMKSRVAVDVESYFFHNEAQFYAFRPGFYYGLKNGKHQFGMSLPLVHTVFKGDYAGFENTTGIGDLRMSYRFAPYLSKDLVGLTRVTLSLDATAPTGEYRLGRGSGVWVYKPGVTLTLTPGPFITFYPDIRYQFSGNPANSLGGSDGLPDPDDPDIDYTVQNLSMELPVVAEVQDWSGWFCLSALYTRSFTENTNFFFIRMDLGKMLGSRSAASLRIAKFISGQPRLNVVVQANVTFFVL